MGQIRKINAVYYIEFYARGLLYSQVAGEDFESAKKLLTKIEEKIASGETLTIARHIELPDFYERFLKEAGNRYNYKTFQRFTAVLEDFRKFIHHDFPQIKQLAQVTPIIIESYKIYLTKTQNTKIVNFSILLLRDVLEYGIQLGFLNDNPTLHVRLLPWPKQMARKLTPRYELARKVLSQGAGLGKLVQLLEIADIAKLIYFANLIPLSWEDVYN